MLHSLRCIICIMLNYWRSEWRQFDTASQIWEINSTVFIRGQQRCERWLPSLCVCGVQGHWKRGVAEGANGFNPTQSAGAKPWCTATDRHQSSLHEQHQCTEARAETTQQATWSAQEWAGARLQQDAVVTGQVAGTSWPVTCWWRVLGTWRREDVVQVGDAIV